MSHVTLIVLLFGNTAMNVVGVILLRYSVSVESPIVAVLGCIFWAGTSVTFLMLLASGKELAVLSTVTASLGFIAVILIGYMFGETLTNKQLLGIAMLLFGIAILSLPKTV